MSIHFSHHDIAINPIGLPQSKKIIATKEESTPKRSRFKLNIMLSIVLSILALVIITGLFLILLKNVNIATINVSGNITLDNEDLLTMIAIDLPAPYFEVNTSEIVSRFIAHPLIFEAKVHKTIYGKLNIVLERSYPLVGVLALINGKQVPSYFDKNGRCVQVGVAAGLIDVPILSGLELVDPQVGVYLPSWLNVLMLDLSTIKQENLDLYTRISEMMIISKGDNYRVLKTSFVGYSTSFISELHLTTHTLNAMWILQQDIEKSHLDEEFTSFDIRQGVIIGKKGTDNNE